MFFDSHAHMTCESVFPEVYEQLDRARAANVSGIINICTDPRSFTRGKRIADSHPWVFNAAATTPHDVEKEGNEVFPIFEEAARSGMLVAVGETGLDYHYEHSSVEIQKDFLKRYFTLALETSLPVIIHCREAFADLFDIADTHYSSDAPLILHCFTGNLDEAKEVIKRGWHLSLSGIVTFKKSTVLQEVAKLVPIRQLLIETDTPYLAPVPHRGKPNEPAWVAHTAEFIANIRGMRLADFARETTRNAVDVFKVAISH